LNLFGALEPQWHHTVRTLYVGAFVLVWLEALGSFLFFLILTRSASPVPTPHLVASVVNHGNVFYVASWQKHLYDLMLTTMFFAIPGIMLTGFILPYVVGFKIFHRPRAAPSLLNTRQERDAINWSRAGGKSASVAISR